MSARKNPRARYGYAATGVVAMPPRADSLCSLRVLSILTRCGPHLELLLIVRLQTTCDRPVKHVRKMT